MSVTAGTLRRFKIFEAFTDVQLGEVARICQREQYDNGAKIFEEGRSAETLYLLLDGKISLEREVQLGRSGSSRQATVSILTPGQALGWSSVVEPCVYTATANCIEPAAVLAINGNEMRRFMAGDPEAGLKLMTAVAEIVRGRMEATTNTLTYFLSIIAHELKSPLAAIENYMEVMLGGFAGDFTEKQQRMLERSALRVKDMRNLISNILDLARMQPENIQADFAWFDPLEMCTEAVENVRLAAAEKGVRLKVALPAAIPQIVGADRRLRQVLSNLLSNAIKFSPEGGVVTLRMRDQPDELVTEVLDEGVGIPADEHGHIFEDFFRGQNVGDVGGTGLGLAIAKKIMEAHQGRIWFESPYAAGKPGTKFSVAIPRNLATLAMKNEVWKSTQREM
jgi:signal transduction histidine kinase